MLGHPKIVVQATNTIKISDQDLNLIVTHYCILLQLQTYQINDLAAKYISLFSTVSVSESD